MMILTAREEFTVRTPAPSSTSALTLTDIHFSYGSHQVLTGLSATIPAGTITALCGPNGAGKSTLFKCCLGHLSAKGSIAYGLRELSTMTTGEIARTVAYVPQDHESVFPFTVWDVVLMGRAPHVTGFTGPDAADHRVCLAALDLLGLTPLAERHYNELSGGQRQLVLIARAVAQDCPFILLDEPTASLDFGHQLLVWKAVGRLRDEGRTVLVCTHDPNHVLWFTDHVLVVGRDGKVMVHGPSQQALTAEVIGQLYPGQADVVRVGERLVVMPSTSP